MNRVIRRIMAGQGNQSDLQLLVDVAGRIEGHTICALGDAAAWPVQGLIRHFRHVIEERIDFQATKPFAPSVPVAAE
jgi:NADH-quinone oxidoreductase subunit F